MILLGIGYIKTRSKVLSIMSGSTLSVTASVGTYHVTAVDIAGNESAPSNKVDVGFTP